MRWTTCVLACLPCLQAAADPKPGPKDVPNTGPRVSQRPDLVSKVAEDRIEASLKALAAAQSPAGCWDIGQALGSYDGASRPVTATAMCGLAFLAHGDGPDRGTYAHNVKAATLWLLSKQDDKGRIHHSEGERPVYGHCFTLLFLAELYGSCADPSLEARVGRAIEKGIAVLEAAQTTNGGWGYTLSKTKSYPMHVVPGSGPPYDTIDEREEDEGSTSIACVQALRAAKNAGFSVRKGVIDKGLDYLVWCQRPSGGIIYKPGCTTDEPAITGAAAAAFFMCGVYPAHLTSPDLRERAMAKSQRRAMQYLLRYWEIRKLVTEKVDDKEIVRAFAAEDGVQMYVFYAHLYLSQAYWMAGGKTWTSYFPLIREWLLDPANGHLDASTDLWKPDQGSGNTYFCTAAALLILQLPYGYLPIMQR